MVDLFTLYRVYFAAAGLAAHSNFASEGFRQKDVRFLLGLFLNWVDATTKNVDEKIHDTQISRYLDGLVKQGHATKSKSGRVPRYQLTRTGLIELASQLMKAPVGAPLEQFFVVYYFAKTYGQRLAELVTQKENQLPRSFRVELEALLDHRELVEHQIKFVQLELRKLDERIAETKGAGDLAQKLARQGATPTDIISAIAKNHPYDLNNQKSMAELFHEIPAPLRVWELTVGNQSRVELLWGPMRQYLAGYLTVLQNLRETTAKISEAS